MAVFNSAKREIDIKIVYYGPALCGKTTNVQYIYQNLAPHQRGELVSLATKDDRTLFFDFLPIELGNVKGFKTRFHMYTVPGQVYYALTRRAVLTGVDGVVFVADSQANKMDENIESLHDLEENLKYYRKELSSLPFIMQYNKRDLDNIVSVEELDATLNKSDVVFFEASAINGSGVMETLTACCRLILQKMDEASAKKDGPIIRIFKQLLPEETTVHPESAASPQHQEEAVPVCEPVIEIPEVELPTEPSHSTQVLHITSLEASPEPEPADQMNVIHILEPEETSPVSEPVISTEPQPEEPVFTIEESLPAEETQPMQLGPSEEVSVHIEYEPLPVSAPQVQELQPQMVSTEIASEVSTPINIITCGQPTVESATSIKLPVTFKIEQMNKECMINILITLDNLTVREPE